MKRVLSLLLAMVMAVSLCACGGDTTEVTETPGVVGATFVVTETDTVEGWTPGESVDPSTVINRHTIPTMGATRIAIGAETKIGTIIKITATVDGSFESIEIETISGSTHMVSRSFILGDQQYAYLQATDGYETVEDVLYRIPAESSTEVDIQRELKNDYSFIKAMDSPDDAARRYTHVEFVELVGGYDTFRAETKDGSKLQLMLNHKTGLLTDILMLADKESTYKSLNVHYDYEVDMSQYDIDVSTAIDDTEGYYTMYMLAQFMLLAGFGN